MPKPQPHATELARRFEVSVPAAQIGQRIARQAFAQAKRNKFPIDELTLSGLCAASAHAMMLALITKAADGPTVTKADA